MQAILVERWFPEAFAPSERGALAALRALDGATRDALATALRGKTVALPAERFPGQTGLIAQLAGWLEPTDAAHGQTSFLAAAPKRLRVPATKRNLWQQVEALSFDLLADESSAVLPRFGLGHFRPLPNSPLAAAANGAWPHHHQPSKLNAGALLACANLANAGWQELWQTVRSHAGAAQHWPASGGDAAAMAGRMLWQAIEEDCVPAIQLPAVLHDMRRAPLDPATTRRLWRYLWQRRKQRKWRQGIAQHVAEWGIWTSGERLRWHLRARAERRQNKDPWPTETLSAPLEHTKHGVRAAGEPVEVYCLRQLAAAGWQGLHAEGQAWQTVLLILAAPVLSSQNTGHSAWLRCLSSRPSDRSTPGFLARRRPAWRRLLTALRHDPVATFDLGSQRWGFAPTNEEPWTAYGFGPQVAPAVARAIVSRLPSQWLCRLLERLLEHPGHSAGLPDLIVWREHKLHLWEVKSPNDTLSDQQRSWLAWFIQHDIQAGVLRVEDSKPTQSDLFGQQAEKINVIEEQPLPPIPASLPRSAQRQRQAKQHRIELPHLAALYTIDWEGLEPPTRLEDNGHLHIMPDGLTVETVLKRARNANPARLRIVPAAAIFFTGNRCGRLIPAGHGLAMMWREEPLPNGDLGRVARLIWRQAGWFLPSDQGWEPILLPRRLQANRSATLDEHSEGMLQARLDTEPINPEHVIQESGQADIWQQQTALLHHETHAVGLRDERPTIALPNEAAVMWVHEAIHRIDVPINPQLHQLAHRKRRTF